MDAMRTRRWVGVVASTWVETTAGNGYTFGLYAPTLKAALSYSQSQLNTLGFAKDLGDNVGILAGLASDRLPVAGILAIGALESLLGYGVLWLVLSGRIEALPYWQMCVLLAVGANSSTWLDTACLVTCMRNFPHRRGTITGILKCSYGLSSAVFTLLYNSLFQNDPASFLLLVALGPSVASLLAVYFIHPVMPLTREDDLREQPSFTLMQFTIAMFILLMLLATLCTGIGFGNILASRILASMTVVFFTVPLAIPLIYPNNISNKVPCIESVHEDHAPLLAQITSLDTSSLLDEKNMAVACDGATSSGGEGAKVPSVRGFERNLTLVEALGTADFWLLFFAFFCGMGSAITAINNLGQLGEAQGYVNVSIFVSLISIWNSIGRLGGGVLGDHFVRLRSIPRPAWMACAQAVMVVAHLLFATALPGSLYAGSVLLGVTFGVHASVIIPTASELFGLKSLGMLYNTLFIASPLGSLLFSGVIAGFLYDSETAAAVGDPLACVGAHCFRVTFLIMAAVCLVGIALNALLVSRTRPLYRSLYGTRRIDDERPGTGSRVS